MAEYSVRVAQNRELISRFLQRFRVYPIDRETADVYGQLKSTIMRHFGPKEKGKRSRTTLQQLGFGDNDLWIAVTALQHNLTLVSRDSDFTRIQQVQPLLLESW